MSTISKTTQSLTTAEEMRNQTKLLMQPSFNWESYLTPAPLSIAILGELVYISSSTDFSINKNPPKGGFKFINYPDSFRACLMQVCNSGWWAFNQAHVSMDKIRLYTAQVPDHMKEAVKILFQGSAEVIEAHLPDQLESIKDIADECLKLSKTTEKDFHNVLRTIDELLEACVNAKCIYGEENEEIKKKLEESKLREQFAQKAKKRAEKAMSDMKKEMDDARENYQKALDSLPSGWEMLGMDVVSSIAKSLTSFVDGTLSFISQGNPANVESHNTNQQSAGDLFAYSKSAVILSYVQFIQECVNVNSVDDEIAWTNLFDQKNKSKSNYFKTQFKNIMSDLQICTDCPSKKEAQELCSKGIEICKELAKYAPDGKCDKDTSNKIIVDILDLNKSALVFDSKSKVFTNSSAISSKPPMMQKVENNSENQSISQRVADNARFAIEQTRTQMDASRQSYEKHLDDIENSEKEINDTLMTLRSCELKEIDFKTTIDILTKGMKAMGKVKEEWVKMVQFFQMVCTIVETSLNKTLKSFITASDKTQKLSYNGKLFSKDMLYNQAFQACNIASLVHMISGTYAEVSDKYLMDRIGSLSKLMTLDNKDPEFQHEQQKLRSGCDQAKESILQLALKNKTEFDRKCTERQKKIDQELLAILPAASSEKIKIIKDAVNAGFNEEDAAKYM